MTYPKTYSPCDDCPYSFSKNNQESNMCKFCEFKQLLDKPTADVVEVKHGRWIDTGDEILDTTYSGWKCSECGYVFCGNKFKFCPECGAKMDVSKMEITTEGGKTE
jgi:rubrerythrin